MDDYCYKFNEEESFEYWFLKQSPQEIISDIAIGKRDIEDKSEIFMTKLEQDKEQFLKSIEVYYKDFQKIKTFKNIDELKEFAVDANGLED